MSCYFRYMKDVLKEAGVAVTPKNKKEIDQAIHRPPVSFSSQS